MFRLQAQAKFFGEHAKSNLGEKKHTQVLTCVRDLDIII